MPISTSTSCSIASSCNFLCQYICNANPIADNFEANAFNPSSLAETPLFIVIRIIFNSKRHVRIYIKTTFAQKQKDTMVKMSLIQNVYFGGFNDNDKEALSLELVLMLKLRFRCRLHCRDV
jgi:hypothetical protein